MKHNGKPSPEQQKNFSDIPVKELKRMTHEIPPQWEEELTSSRRQQNDKLQWEGEINMLLDVLVGDVRVVGYDKEVYREEIKRVIASQTVKSYNQGYKDGKANKN